MSVCALSVSSRCSVMWSVKVAAIFCPYPPCVFATSRARGQCTCYSTSTISTTITVPPLYHDCMRKWRVLRRLGTIFYRHRVMFSFSNPTQGPRDREPVCVGRIDRLRNAISINHGNTDVSEFPGSCRQKVRQGFTFTTRGPKLKTPVTLVHLSFYLYSRL